MQSRVTKWGNSQGLRLSRELLRLAKLSVGDEVEVTVVQQQIVIKKAERKRASLAELVAEIPEDYTPGEVDWGNPVGREEW